MDYTSGVRRTLTPTHDGGYAVRRDVIEAERLTESERADFTQYADLSRVELMRRLRTAEWNAAAYESGLRAMEQSARETPALHVIKEMAGALKRVRGLLDVPCRRNIPKAELVEALDPPRWD